MHQIYTSKLAALPLNPELQDYPFTVQLCLMPRTEESQVRLISQLGGPPTSELAGDWFPCKSDGVQLMEGRFAFLSLSVPTQGFDDLPVRVHFGVAFIRTEEIDPMCLLSEEAVEGDYAEVLSRLTVIDSQEWDLLQWHIKDFDRLMSLAQYLAGEMVEAAGLDPLSLSLDIIAEPLNHRGEFCPDRIVDSAFFASTCFFPGQRGSADHPDRVWMPEKGAWQIIE